MVCLWMPLQVETMRIKKQSKVESAKVLRPRARTTDYVGGLPYRSSSKELSDAEAAEEASAHSSSSSSSDEEHEAGLNPIPLSTLDMISQVS